MTVADPAPYNGHQLSGVRSDQNGRAWLKSRVLETSTVALLEVVLDVHTEEPFISPEASVRTRACDSACSEIQSLFGRHQGL